MVSFTFLYSNNLNISVFITFWNSNITLWIRHSDMSTVYKRLIMFEYLTLDSNNTLQNFYKTTQLSLDNSK